MVHLRKKLRHHFAKKKHHYGIGLLGVANCLIIVFGIFLITRGVNPHTSELAFIEKSVTGIGSVVPASCDSNPPANHFSGDCPAPTVNGSISPSSGYEGYGATLSYSSTNATRCTATNNINGIMFIDGPTSYSLSTNVTSSNRSWTFTCYNAVGASASVVVEATVIPNDCTGTPWGTVAHGYSNTAYSSPTVDYGYACSGQTRTCSNGSMSGSYAYTSCSVLPPPSVDSFYADSYYVYYGSGTTLRWTASGTLTNGCYLYGGIYGGGTYVGAGTSGAVGTGALYGATGYSLYCYDGVNNASARSLTVNVYPPPSIIYFYSSPNPVYYNTASTLYWSFGGTAEYCYLYGGIYGGGTPVGATQGASTGNLTGATTYSVYCYDYGGNSSGGSYTVSVSPPPSVDSFYANPNPIPYNTATTLYWTFSGTVSSCYMSGGIYGGGTSVGSGPVGTGALTSNTNYTLTCYDPAGNSSSRNFTVTVGRAWGATDTSVDNCVIQQGQSTCPITFTWTSYGLTSPDFGACGYTSPNFGGACSVPYTQVSAASGNITYDVSGNGIYTRLAGTPDYLSYQAISSKQAIGICQSIATWNGSICNNPAPSVSLNPTNTSVTIDQPVTYTLTSSDLGPDMTQDSISWKAPGQSLWNWQNGSFGAVVTPGNGYTSFAGTNSKVTTYTFTPSIPGTYTIYGSAFDSAGGGRWTSTPLYTLTVNCTTGYINVNNACVNPVPSVSINPGGTITIPINVPYTFSSVATDGSGDIVIHNLEWMKPNGEYNWQGTDAQGTVSYTGATTFTNGTGNNSLQATFTPTHTGQYKVRFAAQDNTLSNYNGVGSRWTYSPWMYVNVIIGVSGIISQNPVDPTKLKWECFNSNKATLVTTNGPTGGDFTNINLPPNSGFITPAVGATYTITCTNTIISQSKSFSYTQPTLVASNVGATSATLTFNCNNPNAKSMVLERMPGSSVTLNVTSGNRTDLDLTSFTEYKYTLRCFDGLGGTGSQVGTQVISFFTNGSPTSLDLGAYVHAKSTDTSTYSSASSIVATTNDGTFDSWSYRITGTAASCVMDQRNDGGEFFPTPPYASDPTEFTFQFSSLSSSDKTSFASSFAIQHDWRLTCTDTTGVKKSIIWSLLKSNTFPTVIDASLNLDCDGLPPNPTIALQCVNSDWYELKNGAGAVFSSGAGPAATVPLMGEDVYKVNCFQGGPTGVKSRDVFRAYSTSMCTTRPTELIASPPTIRSGGVTTLTWDISQPTSACTITATPVCSGTCSQGRIDEAAAINQQFLTGQTDANDPFSLPGIPRTVMESIQSDAFNNGVSGKALGKKTIRLRFTTDITINCVGGGGAGGGGGGAGGGGAGGVDAIQKLRILVSNENEG